MQVRCVFALCRKVPTKGQDGRRCQYFRLHCVRHPKVPLCSLGEVSQHRKETEETRNNLKILCGCCGKLFRKMDVLASHANSEGFHLRKSKISGYSRSKFDVLRYLSEHPLSDSSTEVVVTAPSTTSGARQPQAAAAVALPSTLLRGAPDVYRLPASCIADALSTLSTPPPGSSHLPSSLAGPSCTSSTAPITTNSSSVAPVRSVFTIHDPIITSCQLPASGSATATLGLETPAGDEASTIPGTPVTSPPAIATPIIHMSDFDTPVFNTPSVHDQPDAPPATQVSAPAPDAPPVAALVPGTQPDSTQAPVMQTPTTQAPVMLSFPTIASFDTLFPPNYFSSVGAMPTTALIHSLVNTLQWTSSLLRGMLAYHPLPPALLPFDESGRTALMATPLWPGDNYDMETDLSALLAGLLPLYTMLLSRGSHWYC